MCYQWQTKVKLLFTAHHSTRSNGTKMHCPLCQPRNVNRGRQKSWGIRAAHRYYQDYHKNITQETRIPPGKTRFRMIWFLPLTKQSLISFHRRNCKSIGNINEPLILWHLLVWLRAGLMSVCTPKIERKTDTFHQKRSLAKVQIKTSG